MDLATEQYEKVVSQDPNGKYLKAASLGQAPLIADAIYVWSIQFYSAYAAAFEPVRRKRDILLIDQRGTGESAHMDCPIDDDIVEGRPRTGTGTH